MLSFCVLCKERIKWSGRFKKGDCICKNMKMRAMSQCVYATLQGILLLLVSLLYSSMSLGMLFKHLEDNDVPRSGRFCVLDKLETQNEITEQIMNFKYLGAEITSCGLVPTRWPEYLHTQTMQRKKHQRNKRRFHRIALDLKWYAA